MDCKTARLLLTFARPQARELAQEEAGALEGHLDRCPECHGLADGQRRFDEQLGQAMNQIEVPASLRDQLLTRLEAERGDWQRRRFARGMRVAIAAAAVVLLSWAGWSWLDHHTRPVLNLDKIESAVNSDPLGDRRAHAKSALKRLGVEMPSSPLLNYNLLIAPPSRAELPGLLGHHAALLVFAQGGRSATVYVIAADQLPVGEDAQRIGGTYKVVVEHAEGEPYGYLIVHNGEDLDWLCPPPEPPAA